MKYSLLLLIVLLIVTIPVLSQESAMGAMAGKNIPEQTAGTASFSVPNKLSYQGLLTTSAGNPVADGAYDLKFDIYNLPSGGVLRHTETLSGVDVVRGAFSVMLHPPTTIFAESLYVEVTAVAGSGISGPLTFSPRSELTSAPYSFAPWITNGSDIYFPGAHVTIGASSYPFYNSYLSVVEPYAFITAKATSASAGFMADKGSASQHNYFVLQTGGADRWTLGTMGNDNFNIHNWTNFGNPLNINLTNNYVGIGTTTPSAQLDVNGDIKVSGNITYATPKTGYLTGSAYATGRVLWSTSSVTYASGGLYNNGTGSAYYLMPINFPDGVTVTNVDVYGADADATVQFVVYFNRQLLSSYSASNISNASSGVSYSSGAVTVSLAPSHLINNSLYAYFIQVELPATSNIRLYSYRITYTYTSQGSVSPPVANEEINGGNIAKPDLQREVSVIKP
jgi:hypothetical protein